MDLLDIVRRHFYRPLTREQLYSEPDIFERLERTPQYRAWLAVRDAGWDNRAPWKELVKKLKPTLPNFTVQNVTMPGTSCYEAAIYTRDPDDPLNNKPYQHGDILTTLVVRVSFFAPIYEIYENRSRVIYQHNARLDENGNREHSYEYNRRTHAITPHYRPPADAFVRAIEAQYGYERVGPEILNIELLNTTMWEDYKHTGTLGQALFSQYRY